jgi:hypothetical protein
MAPPLGERTEVERRLAACFAGLRFDAAGKAAIERPGYSLEMRLDDDDPPRSLLVSVHGNAPAAAVALRRLAQQTGWRAFDAATHDAVDLTAGSLASPSGRDGNASGDSAGDGTPWRAALGGLALAGALALAVGGPPRLTASPTSPATPSADEAERLVLRDIREMEDAQLRFHALNFGYVAPEVLARPERLGPIAAVLDRSQLLDARFLLPVRHGYRFEFRGVEPIEEEGSLPVTIKPAYRDYQYAAIPEQGAGPGRRSFAYYSYRAGVVFAREDAQLSTLEDTMVRLR